MRVHVPAFFIALTLSAVAAAQGQRAATWEERLRAKGEPISWAEVQARVRKARIVYMGEQHGTKEHHILQAKLLETLAAEGPVVLCCEYFPRSMQPLLDAFNRGEVSFERFREHVSWEKTWGFPWEAYAPLFEAAAKVKAQIVALNAEKETARAVRAKGFEGLPWQEMLKLPRIDLSRKEHQEQTYRALQQVHPMPKAMLERYYEAFTLWDDTMADSVCERFLADRRPDLRALVVAGRAHIEGAVGIPDRVQRRLPLERLIVVGGDDDPKLGDVVLLPAPPPAEVVRHHVQVALDPAGRSARIVDRIELRGYGDLSLKFTGGEVKARLAEGVLLSQPAAGAALNLVVERSPAWAEVEYTATFTALQGSAHTLAEQVRRYVGPEGAVLGGSWYPLDASPSPVELTVTGPFEAVTTGKRTARRQVEGGVETTWVCERPFEPLTLVAGPYQVSEKQVGDTTVYAYFYADEAKLAPTYLDAAAGAIQRYERELGPYPFPAFAVVEHFLPTGYGFPGFTLLGSQVVRLPFIAETSLVHEVLHCWWGNGVLVDEEGGNWCEALTSYGADHAGAVAKGEGGRYRWESLADYAAYANDGKEVALSAFRSRHDGATRAVGYGKGAMVFHMLRRQVGEEAWQKLLRRLVQKQMGKEAGWQTIRFTLEMYARQPLGWFFEQWVERAGAPRLELLGAARAGRELRLKLVARDGQRWKLRLPVALEGPGGRWLRDVDVVVSSEPSEVSLPLPAGERIERVVLDPDHDVFRRLLPAEMPQGIRNVLGADPVTIVLPDGGDPQRAAYEALAVQLAERSGGKVVPSAEPKPGTIALGHGPCADELRRRAGAQVVFEPEGYGYREGAAAVRGPGAGLVVAVPVEGGVALLVEGRSPAAVAATLKLLHYGRYRLLLMQDGRVQVKQRAGPPARSPLAADLR
ncbi:MAG: ChaN family lipoprotein [Planctomycetota bacterium]